MIEGTAFIGVFTKSIQAPLTGFFGPTNELLVVKYISIFENKKVQKYSILYRQQQQKKKCEKKFLKKKILNLFSF